MFMINIFKNRRFCTLLHFIKMRFRTTIDGWFLIHRCCHELFKHMNVEFCSSVKSLKYTHKYINKGSDEEIFGFQNEHVEVMRYISTSEAVWPTRPFPTHELFRPSNVVRKTIC